MGSSTAGMNFVLRLSGRPNGHFADPFFVFENSLGSFTIPGVPDIVSRFTYRTQKVDGMSSNVLKQWLTEPRDIPSAPEIVTRHLFLDNVSGFKSKPEAE